MRQHFTGISFPLLFAGIVLGAAPVAAKTTVYSGTMQTRVDMTRTYSIQMPVGLRTLTLTIPLPQSGSVFGYAEDLGQTAIASSLPPTRETETTDDFGNRYHVLEYEAPTAGELDVQAQTLGVALSSDLTTALPQAAFPLTGVSDDAAAYLLPTAHVESGDDQIRGLAQTITAGAQDEAGAAQSISHWMVQNIGYDSAGPTVQTDALAALASRKVKCDGFSNLFLALARASGIPARYTGGYWVKPGIVYPGKGVTAPGVAADHTHAWIELWFAGVGWVPYEPQQTAGFVDTHHLRVWQSPDTAATLHTLQYTADTTTQPDVPLKLTTTFANVTDQVNLTAVATANADEDKTFYVRQSIHAPSAAPAAATVP